MELRFPNARFEARCRSVSISDYDMNIILKREKLRTETLQRREQLASTTRATRSRQIVKAVIEWIQDKDFDSVMLYLSMKSEVETEDLLKYLLRAGKQVCAPVVDMQQRQLIPRRIQNVKTNLVRHRYGMLEPNTTCLIVPRAHLQLIVVPGIAFDCKGYRLGYGKGFYDRFLPKCAHAVAIGLAYQIQLVEDTFPQSWDAPVHKIFTELGVQGALPP